MECQYVCIIVLASVWMNFTVCVQFSGFSLCEVNHPLGHTNKPHSGWHRPAGVHTSWLPVFSLKPTLIVSVWPELWQSLRFKKCERLVPRKGKRGGSKERRWRRSRGSTKKRKIWEMGEKELASISVTPTPNPQRMRLEGEGRKGRRGRGRGAYEADCGLRQSLISREPWVFAVAGNGSSCLGAGLNNTVCLHKVVRHAHFAACFTRISDDSMDWLTGHLTSGFWLDPKLPARQAGRKKEKKIQECCSVKFWCFKLGLNRRNLSDFIMIAKAVGRV